MGSVPWHFKLLPRSQFLGLIALPCSLPYFRAGVLIAIRPCDWITRPLGIIRGGMVYCPTSGGITNYPTSLGCIGTGKCSIGCSSGFLNCPAHGVSNYGTAITPTISSSTPHVLPSLSLFLTETADLLILSTGTSNILMLISMLLFDLLFVLFLVLHRCDSKGQEGRPVSSMHQRWGCQST